MLSLEEAKQRDASFEPRVNVYGTPIPPDFKLPPLSAVYNDAIQWLRLRKTAPPAVSPFGTMNPNLDESIHESVSWYWSMNSLFKFSEYCQESDVPPELLEAVVFVLEMLLHLLMKGSEAQLRALGLIALHQDYADTLYFKLANARIKVSRHLMDPVLDRPKEAVPHMRAFFQQQADRLRSSGFTDDPMLTNLPFYALYCDALVFSDAFDIAQESLRKWLDAARTITSKTSLGNPYTPEIVKARIHLALVLDRLGVDQQEQKDHVDFCVGYLRRNPLFIQRRLIEQMFSRQSHSSHPVLHALGGKAWLKDLTSPRVLSPRKQDHTMKTCMRCGAREPEKILFRCSGCQYTFYCSKACQREHWKHHKDGCKERSASIKRAQELKSVSSYAGKRASDWIKYRDSSTDSNVALFAHALGLHKDPSRGHSHVVMRELEYQPQESKDFRLRFHALRIGVFRIRDVLTEIERLMNLDPGEGDAYIQGLFYGMKPDSVPILVLSWGEGLDRYLSRATIKRASIMRDTHDPSWREAINSNRKIPGRVKLPNNAADMEDVF